MHFIFQNEISLFCSDNFPTFIRMCPVKEFAFVIIPLPYFEGLWDEYGEQKPLLRADYMREILQGTNPLLTWFPSYPPSIWQYHLWVIPHFRSHTWATSLPLNALLAWAQGRLANRGTGAWRVAWCGSLENVGTEKGELRKIIFGYASRNSPREDSSEGFWVPRFFLFFCGGVHHTYFWRR